MTAAGQIAIAFEGVTKRFAGVTALDDVSFDVRRGELLSIVGENGAGKSTLMKILSGVITEYEGRVVLAGHVARFANTSEAEAAGVSIIHQELNLVDQLSAAANIFLGREKCNRLGLLDHAEMNRQAASLLEELECDVPPDERAGMLRVGDQQLVEIAKAVSLEADILIMDEPTSALTEAEVERLYRVIERLRGRGVTILYISHKMDEIFRLSDRITVLRDGRVVDSLARSATNPREITHLMVGREIESIDFGDAPRQPTSEVLRVERLSLAWPGHARRWRLADVSFSLRRGEIVGIAGLMGAGRTELLECIFGASRPRPEGKIFVEGRPVTFRHPSEAKRAGIALVAEDRKRLALFDQLSVEKNTTICQLQDVVRWGMLSARRERRAARDTVKELNVKTAGVQAPITSLSGGNQQKAIVGRWLLTRPKILLLDDPTRGVDVGAKAELYRLMDRLCRQGLGILLTSSELPELLTVCDRILVLCEGRITGEFKQSEASEQKIMEAATLMSSASHSQP